MPLSWNLNVMKKRYEIRLQHIASMDMETAEEATVLERVNAWQSKRELEISFGCGDRDERETRLQQMRDRLARMR